MTTLQQKLWLAPPEDFIFDESDEASDPYPNRKHQYPRLLFVAPALSGLVFLTWVPSIWGVILAAIYATLAATLYLLVLSFARRRLASYAPDRSPQELEQLARFVLTPMWITEACRIIAAESLFVFARQDPVGVFRNIMQPRYLLFSPAELFTVVGMLMVLLRFYFVARPAHNKFSKVEIMGGALSVVGMTWVVFALCSIVAIFAAGGMMQGSFRSGLLQ